MRVELPNQFRLGAIVGRETSSGQHPPQRLIKCGGVRKGF